MTATLTWARAQALAPVTSRRPVRRVSGQRGSSLLTMLLVGASAQFIGSDWAPTSRANRRFLDRMYSVPSFAYGVV